MGSCDLYIIAFKYRYKSEILSFGFDVFPESFSDVWLWIGLALSVSSRPLTHSWCPTQNP